LKPGFTRKRLQALSIDVGGGVGDYNESLNNPRNVTSTLGISKTVVGGGVNTSRSKSTDPNSKKKIKLPQSTRKLKKIDMINKT
jgi:hypothetical protein